MLQSLELSLSHFRDTHLCFISLTRRIKGTNPCLTWIYWSSANMFRILLGMSHPLWAMLLHHSKTYKIHSTQKACVSWRIIFDWWDSLYSRCVVSLYRLKYRKIFFKIPEVFLCPLVTPRIWIVVVIAQLRHCGFLPCVFASFQWTSCPPADVIRPLYKSCPSFIFIQLPFSLSQEGEPLSLSLLTPAIIRKMSTIAGN